MFVSFSSSEKIIEKSHRLLEKGKVEKAVQILNTPLRKRFDLLTRQDPRNLEAARILGDLCLENGDRSDYIRQMRTILQSEPGKAEDLFEKTFPLLGEHPEDRELTLFLGELALEQPERERPLILLRYFIRLAGKDADRAMPLLEGLREKDPAFFEVHLALAEGWSSLGSREKALEALREAVRLEPERSLLSIGRGCSNFRRSFRSGRDSFRPSKLQGCTTWCFRKGKKLKPFFLHRGCHGFIG